MQLLHLCSSISDMANKVELAFISIIYFSNKLQINLSLLSRKRCLGAVMQQADS